MSALKLYQEKVIGILNEVFDGQVDVMERVAQCICDCVSGGHLLYVFGTGHAHMLAEELFYRAGGMASVAPILDERLMLHIDATGSTDLERQSGYAEKLLEGYPIAPGDVLIICSNSGRNAVPVELAQLARAKGVTVVALTNKRHSAAFAPRNALGLRLMETADYVLDNGGCVGDAAIDVGIGHNVGATSSAVGTAMLEALVCRAVELSAQRGAPIDVFYSGNIDGGDEANESLNRRYKGRIRGL